MKTVNKIILITLAVVSFGLSNIYAQTNSFYVYVKQNNKKMKITKFQTELVKQPFEIYVESTAKMDLIVQSSFNPGIYNEAVKGNLLLDLIDPELQKKAVSIFSKKNILQTDGSQNLKWEKDKTDCDSIQKIGNRYTSVKKIEKIVIPKVYFDEKTNEKKQIKMSSPMQFVKDDLFLIFLYFEKDKSGDNVEVQREMLKIKWVDVYKEDTDKFQKNKKKKDKLKVKEAERKLKFKQKQEKKQKKALDRLDESKDKRQKKEKQKEEKDKQKENK